MICFWKEIYQSVRALNAYQLEEQKIKLVYEGRGYSDINEISQIMQHFGVTISESQEKQ